jgi:hypothetical protein
MILISYSLVSGKRGVASTGEIRVKYYGAKARLPFSMIGFTGAVEKGFFYLPSPQGGFVRISKSIVPRSGRGVIRLFVQMICQSLQNLFLKVGRDRDFCAFIQKKIASVFFDKPVDIVYVHKV